MVYVFLAEGFEEIEATVPIDLLRRAGIRVVTIAVASRFGADSRLVEAAHGVRYECDAAESELYLGDSLEAVVLPGGMPGAANLAASGAVKAALEFADKKSALIAAICAAPTVLQQQGLLAGKRATVFPAEEYIAQLGGSYADEGLVYDAPILTAKAAGWAFEFALKIIEILKGEQAAKDVAAAVYYNR